MASVGGCPPPPSPHQSCTPLPFSIWMILLFLYNANLNELGLLYLSRLQNQKQ